MSHFKVAVVVKHASDVEKLLAPFQENNMGDCLKEYLEFYDSFMKDEKNKDLYVFMVDCHI